jgi:hypothetical protein
MLAASSSRSSTGNAVLACGTRKRTVVASTARPVVPGSAWASCAFHVDVHPADGLDGAAPGAKTARETTCLDHSDPFKVDYSNLANQDARVFDTVHSDSRGSVRRTS